MIGYYATDWRACIPIIFYKFATLDRPRSSIGYPPEADGSEIGGKRFVEYYYEGPVVQLDIRLRRTVLKAGERRLQSIILKAP
jgi:hypothetical protein